MVDTIKNAKKGQSVGMVISHLIAKAAASNPAEDFFSELSGEVDFSRQNNDVNSDNENDVHVDCEGMDDVEEVSSISDSDSIRSDTEQSDTTHPSPIIVLEIYCHHHIRNVWWGALVKKTTNMLRTALAGSLDEIDSRLRVDSNMKISSVH